MQEQQLLLYLLKRSDFPKFEQSQHTSANIVKEVEDVFFYFNKAKGQTLGCAFALVRSTNIHKYLTFTFRVNASKVSREVLH